MSLMGSTIPFRATREEGATKGDPRPSIEERYPIKAVYLEQVRPQAQRLVEEGYLLAEHLELVVGQAARRYELLGPVREAAAAAE
jgi:hypothetical protein